MHDKPKAQGAQRAVLVYVSVIGCIGAGVIGHSLWQLTRGSFDPQWLWLVALTVALLAAVGVGRARQSGLRAAAFLFSSSSVVLLLASVAVTVFSWRYQLPQLVLLPPAAAIGLTALTTTRDTGATPAATESKAAWA